MRLMEGVVVALKVVVRSIGRKSDKEWQKVGKVEMQVVL